MTRLWCHTRKKWNPTGHFIILEPQNMLIDVSERHNIIWSADLKALTLGTMFDQEASRERGRKPDQPFQNFKHSQLISLSNNFTYSSEMSIDGFWGSKIVERVGRELGLESKKKVFHYVLGKGYLLHFISPFSLSSIFPAAAAAVATRPSGDWPFITTHLIFIRPLFSASLVCGWDMQWYSAGRSSYPEELNIHPCVWNTRPSLSQFPAAQRSPNQLKNNNRVYNRSKKKLD